MLELRCEGQALAAGRSATPRVVAAVQQCHPAPRLVAARGGQRGHALHPQLAGGQKAQGGRGKAHSGGGAAGAELATAHGTQPAPYHPSLSLRSPFLGPQLPPAPRSPRQREEVGRRRRAAAVQPFAKPRRAAQLLKRGVRCGAGGREG